MGLSASLGRMGRMQIHAFSRSLASLGSPRSAASEPASGDRVTLSHPAGCACCQPATGPVPAGQPSLRQRLDALKLKPEEVTHVLYHDPCFDGYGAAWAAHRALGDRAQYIGVNYDEPVPELPRDAKVAIVDFSYPREKLLALKEQVADLVVLDHHKTAEEGLQGLSFAVFEKTRAGAGIAWEYFHPHKAVPALVSYVEDRDLWKWELPQSREVSAALASYPREFSVWNQLDTDLERLKTEGGAIRRYKDQLVEATLERVRTGNIRGYQVPIVNTPAELRSEVGDAMCEKFPEAPFVALYFDDAQGDRKWSLRSRGEFDATTVARTFPGGGGHPQACGFEQPRANLSEEWLA